MSNYLVPFFHSAMFIFPCLRAPHLAFVKAEGEWPGVKKGDGSGETGVHSPLDRNGCLQNRPASSCKRKPLFRAMRVSDRQVRQGDIQIWSLPTHTQDISWYMHMYIKAWYIEVKLWLGSGVTLRSGMLGMERVPRIRVTQRCVFRKAICGVMWRRISDSVCHAVTLRHGQPA